MQQQQFEAEDESIENGSFFEEEEEETSPEYFEDKCRNCGATLNGKTICPICEAELISVDPNFLINEEDELIFTPINTKIDIIPRSDHWDCMNGSAIKVKIWEHIYNGKVIGWERTSQTIQEGRQMFVRTADGYILIDPYTSNIQAIQIWEPDQ